MQLQLIVHYFLYVKNVFLMIQDTYYIGTQAGTKLEAPFLWLSNILL